MKRKWKPWGKGNLRIGQIIRTKKLESNPKSCWIYAVIKGGRGRKRKGDERKIIVHDSYKLKDILEGKGDYSAWDKKWRIEFLEK